MKEKLKLFFLSDWTFTEKCLLLADVLLAGILFGWLTSPFKHGGFFSNNTIEVIPDDESEEEEME